MSYCMAACFITDFSSAPELRVFFYILDSMNVYSYSLYRNVEAETHLFFRFLKYPDC